MTIQETGAIMRILKANYPNWKADKDTLLLWSQMFADDSVQIVGAAVKAFIAQDDKGFAPVIGQIKQLILKATDTSLGEGEAWSLVRKAISNGIYGSNEEYKALPLILQRVVGSPDQLEQWAMLTDGLDTVVQSQVKRAYRQELEKEQFTRSLPTDVRAALSNATIKMLEGGKA